MAGSKENRQKLNYTLEIIVDILKENNYNDWFIAYGTLLGIARESSCIEGDDDIDILCNFEHRVHLYNILKNNNFTFTHHTEPNGGIIKTNATDKLASIDFYLADVDDKGNYYDRWERCLWTNCFVNEEKTFNKINWHDRTLNLPNDHILKIKRRYGKDWTTPKSKAEGGGGIHGVDL